MFFLLKDISLMQIQLKDKQEKCISVTRIFYNSIFFYFPWSSTYRSSTVFSSAQIQNLGHDYFLHII
jgi:hypothetical protein